MSQVHIAVVSDQILANLIPALMERPDRMILICSESMRRRGEARRQKAVFRQHDLQADVWDENIPEGPLDSILDFSWRLAQSLQDQNRDAAIVLNATGGTKLMTLGLVEAFRNSAERILYANTARARIEVLHDSTAADVPSPSEPMVNVLNVKEYLAAQGFRLQSSMNEDSAWRNEAKAHKRVCKFLGQHAAELEPLFGILNALAGQVFPADIRSNQESREYLASPVQHFRHRPAGLWREALGHLDGQGLLRWDGNLEVQFPNTESVRFVNGGWLEEYAWHMVHDAGVADCRIGVKGVWSGAERAGNEFDVLACHLNQLLFIECKTLKFDSGQNDNEIAYKVESLGQDTRGLLGETWLVTARNPSEVLRHRARQARFEVIGPCELPRLNDRVREWMARG